MDRDVLKIIGRLLPGIARASLDRFDEVRAQ